MTNKESITVGEVEYEILPSEDKYFYIGDRIFVDRYQMDQSTGGPIVGIVKDFHHHSYGDYASIEVESPPEHKGKIATSIYSGKVLKR